MRRFVEVAKKSEIPESGAIGSHFNIETGRVTMDPRRKTLPRTECAALAMPWK